MPSTPETKHREHEILLALLCRQPALRKLLVGHIEAVAESYQGRAEASVPREWGDAEESRDFHRQDGAVKVLFLLAEDLAGKGPKI